MLIEEALNQLGLAFSPSDIKKALKAAANDPQVAIDLLLSAREGPIQQPVRKQVDLSLTTFHKNVPTSSTEGLELTKFIVSSPTWLTDEELRRGAERGPKGLINSGQSKLYIRIYI